jgi:signal transduction histidine kinase
MLARRLRPQLKRAPGIPWWSGAGNGASSPPTHLAVTTALIVCVFIAAGFVNVVLLPGEHLVSSLYAIPILIAGHLASPRVVVATIAIAIAIYLQNAFMVNRPLIVWPFSVTGILIVGYLTLFLSAQRREIAARAEELDRARHQLQQFIGMVSHDLAGSITGIIGSAELLTDQRRSADPDVRDWASSALDASSAQLLRLLRDLRDAASIGEGRFSIERTESDLVDIARRSVTQFQSQYGANRIVLDTPAQLPGLWDRERLGQLITNLISNAVKYSPPHEPVRVSLRQRGDDVRLSVIDHGPGIPDDLRQHLFEPFSRLSRNRSVDGTGLGLCIAKAIAEAHGGSIWVDSAVGRGSAFHVLLPVEHAQATAGSAATRTADARLERAAASAESSGIDFDRTITPAMTSDHLAQQGRSGGSAA